MLTTVANLLNFYFALWLCFRFSFKMENTTDIFAQTKFAKDFPNMKVVIDTVNLSDVRQVRKWSGKKFFKVMEQSGNFILSQGKFTF